MKKIFFISILAVSSLFLGSFVLANSSQNLSGWAWTGYTQNSGLYWMSLNSSNCDSDEDGITDQGNYYGCPIGMPVRNYGVNIKDDGYLEGYAWIPSLAYDEQGREIGNGWIRFDPPAGEEGYPQEPNQPAKLEIRSLQGEPRAVGVIEGWARACAVFVNQVSCEGDLRDNLGGWDGWIKMSQYIENAPDEGVRIIVDEGFPSPCLLEKFAWGGEYNVGWISFANYDGYVLNYGVILGENSIDESLSSCGGEPDPPPPLCDPVNSCGYDDGFGGIVDDPIYGCGTGINTIVRWTFSNPSFPEDVQTAYQIQVDDDTNFDDPNDPLVSDSEIVENSSSNSYTLYQNLEYNETYYWRVRVWGENSTPSNWSTGFAFNTPNSAYPTVDFSPILAFVDERTDFFDRSSAAQGLSIVSWLWNFGEDATVNPNELTEQNPTNVVFNSTGDKTVSLRVTDSFGKFCSIDKTVNVRGSGGFFPWWKEINPFPED